MASEKTNISSLFFKKIFLLCLTAIAAVSGDVSHLLQGGSNGYNYQQPQQPQYDQPQQPQQPQNSYLPPSQPRKLLYS